MARQMTFAGFLKVLRRIRGRYSEVVGCPTVGPARFHLNKDGQIDSVSEQLCPIHEAAWRTLSDDALEDCEDVFDKGRSLGLSYRDIGLIVKAADGKSRGHYRRELLKACGIK